MEGEGWHKTPTLDSGAYVTTGTFYLFRKDGWSQSWGSPVLGSTLLAGIGPQPPLGKARLIFGVILSLDLKLLHKGKGLGYPFVFTISLESIDFDAFFSLFLNLVLLCTKLQIYIFKESNTSIRLAVKITFPHLPLYTISNFFSRFFWYLSLYLWIASGITSWFFNFKHYLVGFSQWKMKI